MSSRVLQPLWPNSTLTSSLQALAEPVAGEVGVAVPALDGQPLQRRACGVVAAVPATRGAGCDVASAATGGGDAGARWKCSQMATAIPSTNSPTSTGMMRPT